MARRHGELGRGKAWRAEANDGIAREAEPFERDAEGGVELVVAIFVVDQRDGIVAGRQVVEFDVVRPGNWHSQPTRGRIFFASRKHIGARRHAH